jgi:hypothetical protein
MAKRRAFICACGVNASKTAPNYYAQIRRLGYALCTQCSRSKNAKDTSERLKNLYKNRTKNRDIISLPCDSCGKHRLVQYRTKRNGYFSCKSCAAKANRARNVDIYNTLAKNRSNDNGFCKKVSDGMMLVSKELRNYRSGIAHKIRWLDNKSERLAIFIDKSKVIHEDKYDYSLVEYNNHTTKVKIKCKIHGIFEMTPKHHALDGYGCPRCSDLRVISSGHNEIAQFIESLNIKVDHNVKHIIKPYELDMVIASHALAIEYHGVYWHSYGSLETYKERMLHHTKNELTSNSGYQLFQIFETEWIQKTEIVKGILLSKLGLTKRLHARKYKLRVPLEPEYKEFMNSNHLQGYRPSSYKIGLYDDDILLMAIGISKHPKYSFELIRMATKLGYTIVGGVSKLLSKAQKDLKMNNLMTYADRRFSAGKGYLSCGFRLVENTNPNYFYTTGSKSKPLYSRQHFQKHKLAKRLKYFDPLLSEALNMFLNGYRRLWDAGHAKLIKTWD